MVAFTDGCIERTPRPTSAREDDGNIDEAAVFQRTTGCGTRSRQVPVFGNSMFRGHASIGAAALLIVTVHPRSVKCPCSTV